MKRITLVVAACVSLAAGGCQRDGRSPAAASSTVLSPAGQAAIARLDASAARTAAAAQAGLSFSDASLRRQPDAAGGRGQWEIHALFHNAGSTPVEGVDVVITFLGAGGLVVGGHNTRQFFRPAVPPGGQQGALILAPLLGGSADGALAVRLDAGGVASNGDAGDGWRPITPQETATVEP